MVLMMTAMTTNTTMSVEMTRLRMNVTMMIGVSTMTTGKCWHSMMGHQTPSVEMMIGVTMTMTDDDWSDNDDDRKLLAQCPKNTKTTQLSSIPKGDANVDTSSIFLHAEEDAESLFHFFADDTNYAEDK